MADKTTCPLCKGAGRVAVGVAAAVDAVAKFAAESMLPAAPRPPVEWGEPFRDPVMEAMDLTSWIINAACGCDVMLWSNGKVRGLSCPAHSLSDLVEGERRLRVAQQEGK